MDKNTLVIIAVTAAITTIVVGVLNWMYAIFDAIIPISTTSTKVKKIFSARSNRLILVDAALFIFWVVLTCPQTLIHS